MSSIAKLKVEGGDEAVETINRVQKSLDKLNKVQAKNRDATRLLDKATGGAVTKFQDLQKGVAQGIKGIGGLSKSFKGLKGAIAATGIGLIVVALGTIVAYWDDIKALVSGVTREQKDLLVVQQESVAESEKGFNLISQTTNLLKESGATEKDILGLKMQSTQETITALKAQLLTQKQVKKSQVDTAKRNKEILEGFLKMITLPLFVLLETIDSIGKALGKQFGLTEGLYGSLGNLIFDPEGVEEAGEKSIQETEDKLLELENRQSGFRQKIDSINKAADKKAEAHQWLRDQGLGDIVKNNIIVSFGQGEDNKAVAYATLARSEGYEPIQEEKVHPQTLKVVMKEWKDKGREVPSELFWTFDGNQTSIKNKK